MTASTATTMASEARRLRLAGGRGSSGNNRSSNNVVEVDKGKREAHNLSPAARRRLLRSQRAHSSEDESYADISRGGGTGSATNNKHIRRSQGHRIDSREDTQLSLHVAESSSLDSDDNGTCFNSVGTASRHPSPTKNRRRQQQHQQQNRRYRVDELTTLNESATSRDDSKSGRNNDRSSIWNQPQDMVSSSNSRHKASDDNTVYSDYDQMGRFHRRGDRGGMGGNASITGGGASSVASSLKTGEVGDDLDDAMLGFQSISPLKQVGQNVGGWTSDKDTNDKVDEVLSKPNVKTALGIAAAATVGAAIMGPVGVLVGAASIGIGIGVMQIPEEQRSNVASHASTSLEKARAVALDVSENMGKSCAKFYDKETGKDNPDALGDANEIMDRCCSIGNEEQEDGTAGERHIDIPLSPIASGGQHGVKGMVGDTFGDKNSPSHSMSENRDNLMPENVNTRAAACGRVGRVVPLGQIHSLRPSLQPRAWLDVMASAYTTRDDKNEAMQEILILAKDKDISRWFLEVRLRCCVDYYCRCLLTRLLKLLFSISGRNFGLSYANFVNVFP